jgi:hypothetical protein
MNMRLQPWASQSRSRSPRSPSSVLIASAAISASATSVRRAPSIQLVTRPGPSSFHRSCGADGTSAAASLIVAIAVRGGRRLAARAVNAARIAVRSSRIRQRSWSTFDADGPRLSPRARSQPASARASGSRSTDWPRGSISVFTSANAIDVSSPGAGGGLICSGILTSMLRRSGQAVRRSDEDELSAHHGHMPNPCIGAVRRCFRSLMPGTTGAHRPDAPMRPCASAGRFRPCALPSARLGIEAPGPRRPRRPGAETAGLPSGDARRQRQCGHAPDSRTQSTGGSGAAERRPADGGARRDDRDDRASLGTEGARFLHREPAMGRHRLRAGVRQPAAARWKARRPVRAQVDPDRWPGRVLDRLGDRRSPRRSSAIDAAQR